MRLCYRRRAQDKVPKWYGRRCVLSGDLLSQGAHIIPARSADEVGDSAWNILRLFWPVEDLDNFGTRGHETVNILPLAYNAHRHWDKFHFALRPIRHPTDPQHRLYLQMAWSGDLHNLGHGWVHGDGTVTDFRRPISESYPGLLASSPSLPEAFPAVCHGDVFEFVTSNPHKFPLPSFHFLEIQYAVHKLLGGIVSAASNLAAIFGGDPPDDEGPVPQDMEVPFVWDFLIDAARDAGCARRRGRYLLETVLGGTMPASRSKSRAPGHVGKGGETMGVDKGVGDGLWRGPESGRRESTGGADDGNAGITGKKSSQARCLLNTPKSFFGRRTAPATEATTVPAKAPSFTPSFSLRRFKGRKSKPSVSGIFEHGGVGEEEAAT